MMSGMTAGGEVSIKGRFELFDAHGRLAEDAREIWSVVEAEAATIARAFWTCYARSSEVVRRSHPTSSTNSPAGYYPISPPSSATSRASPGSTRFANMSPPPRPPGYR
jgi:hypothetical protein